MKIGKLTISQSNLPLIISEISGNHNGRMEIAMKLVKHAAKNGSDLIKLQTYTADNLTLNSNRPEFKIINKKSIWKNKNLFKLYKAGSTAKEWHYKLFKEAKKYKVDCFTSIFDPDDIEFLEKLNVPAYKIASFECLHFPLIKKVIKTKKPILISVGLCNFKEINEIIKFLKKNNCKKYALLKCTSNYPADSSSLNLRTISDMRKKFKCEIGFSDHSIGFNAAIGAVHHGASFIEKHICLNKKIGIDSKFSLEVEKLKSFKSEIISSYYSRGKIYYGPTKSEMPNLQFRRSIFASQDIKKGEKFTQNNIKVIRPSMGIEPKFLNNLIGRKSLKDIKFANPIKWKYVKK
tara:strand:+ start:211 stop:1254 length:1044 start_codon:yes stop_codon:yes gene_type:complete